MSTLSFPLRIIYPVFLLFFFYPGCSKCFKEFPRKSFGEKPDFSGFDRESWQPRSDKDHRAAADKVCQARTPSDVKKFSSESGARSSVLFQLPYYDAIRFSLIDPMHNLLLGSAKNVLKTWIAMGILNESDMQKLQKRVNLIKPPSEIGRIPGKSLRDLKDSLLINGKTGCLSILPLQ